ncbi:MAG: peroxiredoxin [Nitriliruptoraceae bacterium]|jgi:peroxiredoxin
MATLSQMVPLGTLAPPIELPTADGGQVRLSQLAAPVVCVMFLCNHCPYVVHIEDEIARLTSDGAFVDVAFIGVCSNDPVAYPSDGPDGLRAQVARTGWTFPYAIDGASTVGRSYGASCTPDFFVYDSDRELVYRGAMDGSSPGNSENNDGLWLRSALRDALAGRPVSEPHVPSMGCSIKWAGQ